MGGRTKLTEINGRLLHGKLIERATVFCFWHIESLYLFNEDQGSEIYAYRKYPDHIRLESQHWVVMSWNAIDGNEGRSWSKWRNPGSSSKCPCQAFSSPKKFQPSRLLTCGRRKSNNFSYVNSIHDTTYISTTLAHLSAFYLNLRRYRSVSHNGQASRSRR